MKVFQRILKRFYFSTFSLSLAAGGTTLIDAILGSTRSSNSSIPLIQFGRYTADVDRVF